MAHEALAADKAILAADDALSLLSVNEPAAGTKACTTVVRTGGSRDYEYHVRYP